MSSSPTPTSASRIKKVYAPKHWKRPHSTVYQVNQQFGNSLYSDKIGEINGRKFNSELPWTMRNSGGSSTTTSGSYNQGYLSTLATICEQQQQVTGGCGSGSGGLSAPSSTSSGTSGRSYAELLEITNPHRFSEKSRRLAEARNKKRADTRIDFHDQYEADFNREIDHLNNSSLLANEPLLRRKFLDNYLDYDHELGVFVPSHNRDLNHRDLRQPPRTSYITEPVVVDAATKLDNDDDADFHLEVYKINKPTFNLPTPAYTTQTNSNSKLLLPKYECRLASSPYGQSADGRKLSLGSINPASYRPSLPQKTSTAHASDGEEFEFQDRSSPFYTDRWAGKTIRHFDSDLYSNANLFKSMIL